MSEYNWNRNRNESMYDGESLSSRLEKFRAFSNLSKEERQARIDAGKAWRKEKYPALMNEQELKAHKENETRSGY